MESVAVTISEGLRALRWHWRRFLSRLGRMGLIGAGLLLFAVVFELGTVRPLGNRVRHLEDRIQEARTTQRARQITAQASPSQREEIDLFLGAFPATSSAPDWLEKIYDAAEQEHLRLLKGEYRAVDDKRIAITRYEISLPVKGSYRQIRAFVSAALAAVPALSLDGLAVKRQKIDDPDVEAQIVMTLHLRPRA